MKHNTKGPSQFLRNMKPTSYFNNMSVYQLTLVTESTKPNTNVNRYGKPWVVEPSAKLFAKKGVSLEPSVIIDLTQAILLVRQNRTIDTISKRFYWPKMGSDIKNYFRSCLREKPIIPNQPDTWSVSM